MRECRSSIRRRNIHGSRVRDVMKLDQSKVRWIIRRKAEGTMTNREIAETMNVSVIWVKKL